MGAHNLQNRGEDNAPGANTVLQSFNIGGFINSPLRGIERNHRRGPEACRAQRLIRKDAGCRSSSQALSRPFL
jgi:hypothetical protein